MTIGIAIFSFETLTKMLIHPKSIDRSLDIQFPICNIYQATYPCSTYRRWIPEHLPPRLVQFFFVELIFSIRTSLSFCDSRNCRFKRRFFSCGSRIFNVYRFSFESVRFRRFGQHGKHVADTTLFENVVFLQNLFV